MQAPLADQEAGQCRLRQRRPEEATRSPEERANALEQQPARRGSSAAQPGGKSQFSSFILFASVIILINLCSFQLDPPSEPNTIGARQLQPAIVSRIAHSTSQHHQHHQLGHRSAAKNYLTYLDTCLEFVKLLFRQPMRLNGRTTRYTLAEARVLGKMAKVWYIKKKIKKLSKKLKKHTIAVPVFTAIPIYEHSYYPQPHVTHVSHGGMHHAASSYSPAAQLATAASTGSPLAAPAGQQQMAPAASTQHQVAYRMGSHMAARGAGAMYHHPAVGGSHHIINAYAPSPPMYVDESGGLYGHYGNAYGRYDGGYHVW